MLLDVNNQKKINNYKQYVNNIVKRYMYCKKNNDILVIPIQLPAHANLLLFNPFLKQIEHFEPHGQKGIFSRSGAVVKKHNRNLRVQLETLTKWVNENLPQDEKLTLIDNNIVYEKFCGFQHKGSTARKGLMDWKGTKLYFKDNGYCAGFAYLYIYLRLSSPKIDYKVLVERFLNKSPEEVYKILRGFLKTLFIQTTEALINNVKLSLDDIVELYDDALKKYKNQAHADKVEKMEDKIFDYGINLLFKNIKD